MLVGNETKDDAAVYDLGNGIGIISTTDFSCRSLTPHFEFGRIAATNAISDILQWVVSNIMAILGWPNCEVTTGSGS